MEKSRAIELLEHLAWDRDIERNPYGDALNMAIKALKAQLFQQGTTSDLISRQAVIDIERNATVDTNPSHFEAHQKFTQFMDDAEISSFGRWQWSNGFNTALTAVGIDLKKLPPAQPEPQEGHWIKHETPDGGEQYECSRCGVLWEFNDGTPEDNEAYFCPNCGADMRGEKDG